MESQQESQETPLERPAPTSAVGRLQDLQHTRLTPAVAYLVSEALSAVHDMLASAHCCATMAPAFAEGANVREDRKGARELAIYGESLRGKAEEHAAEVLRLIGVE